MRRLIVPSVLLLSVLLSGCAEKLPGSAAPAPSTWSGSTFQSPPSEEVQRYEVNGLVLQGSEEPAVLCLGDMAFTPPLQCLTTPTMPITNWGWERVEGEIQEDGVTWGEFHLVGTHDWTSFTVLAAGPMLHAEHVGHTVDIPCSEPEGGWVPTHPERTTDDDLRAAGRYIDGQPDSAGYWIQYLQQPTDGGSVGFPTNPLVLIAAFNDDADRHRHDLSGVWGGPLCVVEYARTEADLSRIHEELPDPGSTEFGIQVLWSGTDVEHNRVDVGVVVFDEEAQSDLDDRYGEGAVHQVPELVPVD